MSEQSAKTDYKETVFLPRTDFPMRAGLPQKEPEILDFWRETDLYARLRRLSAGREKYVLHDGPPYANGHLHIGHALNKILKDFVVRTRQMMGFDANYVPGWDCHGLPIEWKIEEQYREKGHDKDEVPILQFRQECREFAQHWVDVQSEEFQRLGVVGDWRAPYLTMTRDAEAQIVREIHRFAANGGLYRGLKPVLWSVVEKTALADAEVEYHDHVSTTIHVTFPVRKAANPALDGVSAVAWTTTPWTMPGNRALAYGEDLDYGIYRVTEVAEGGHVAVGSRLLVATALYEGFAKEAGIAAAEREVLLKGRDLAGTIARHPLAGHSEAGGGYDHDVPLLPADFVTVEQGTGIVHIAPGHGADDYDLGLEHGLEVAETVSEDGRYMPSVPLFAGRVIYDQHGRPGDANKTVIEAIAANGNLVAVGRLEHQYPHSWRSKAPLIFRATSQWFISMEANDLRGKAMRALKETAFYPKAGYNRLSSMIAGRPDWCISRQRSWGVPIAIFVHRDTGEVLTDAAVFDRIAAIFEAEGSDAWFARDPADFLGNAYDAELWRPVTDIVEVWFESGSTHAFVLEKRADLKWPASMYLEGSDQHRGWFHSSLLESCGTRGRAPYDSILTHGFTLDEKGRKMSKSLGNQVAPQDVIAQSGADILRVWVASVEYAEDQRIGPEILKTTVDTYRRLRNTLRYLLGAVGDFDPAEAVPAADMPELERWVLHRLSELDDTVRRTLEEFDFNAMFLAVHAFCNEELSAFYLDIRKDSLYCDHPRSPRRLAARTVMNTALDCLMKWLAPVIAFTAEEAWLTRHGRDAGSVHEQLFPTIDDAWKDAGLAQRWAAIRRVRRVVTGALEKARAEKQIGASLQAHPTIHCSQALADLLGSAEMADIAITSAVTIQVGEGPAEAFRLPDVPDVAVTLSLAEGDKCQRCWKVLPEVGETPAFPDLCQRCAEVVGDLRAAAE